ncbi:MAG: 4Fe-4S binding protein [Bacillota bacterium]
MAKQYKWDYVIDAVRCMACAACEVECNSEAVIIDDSVNYAIDLGACTRCARCFNACPVEAISRLARE